MNENEFLRELDELLLDVDLSKVNSEGHSRELSEGYYLCSLKKGELVPSKKDGKVQAKLTFVTKEDGYYADEEGNFVKIKNTSNIYAYKYYKLLDVSKFEAFVSDMLKFEDEPEHSVLSKDMFKSSDMITTALEVLEDMQIYINVTNKVDENGNITDTWYNLISWKRAKALGLPVE